MHVSAGLAWFLPGFNPVWLVPAGGGPVAGLSSTVSRADAQSFAQGFAGFPGLKLLGQWLPQAGGESSVFCRDRYSSSWLQDTHLSASCQYLTGIILHFCTAPEIPPEAHRSPARHGGRGF